MLPLFRPSRYDDWPFVQRIWNDRPSVGPDFFTRLHARGLANSPPERPRGLIPNLPALCSDGFDPDALHPRIVEFYTRPERFRIWLERVSWEKRARLLSHFYDVLVRHTGNMVVPPRVETPRRMSSDLYELDLGYGEVGTSWVRGYAGLRDIFYVAGVKAFVHEGRSFFSLAFPFRRVNLTVVLEAQNVDGDGLRLATDGGGVAGTYLILPGEERFVALPGGPTVERLTFHATPDGGLEGRHEDRAFGVTLFEVDYAVVPLP